MILPSASRRLRPHVLRNVLLSCLLIIAVCLITPPDAGAWSSVRDNPGYGSHITISRMAYALLKNDPAFRGIVFPSFNDIVTEGTVTIATLGDGPGPDNPANAPYSAHYYNPTVRAGGAPAAAASAFNKLKKDLFYAPRLSLGAGTAKAAAWLAHFVQDMTVPYHVLGAPPNFNFQEKTHHMVTGPRTPKIAMGTLLDRYRSDHKTAGTHAANVDWFEAWYYDGYDVYNKNGTTWTSTHFTYERQAIMTSFTSPKALYSTLWHNTQPVDEFTRQIATYTRKLVDSNPDTFNPTGATTISLLSSSVIHTYTVWRASFSGLRAGVASIKPVSGKPGIYGVTVTFENLAKEAATKITSDIIIEDNAAHQRTIKGPAPNLLQPTTAPVIELPPVEVALTNKDVLISVVIRGSFHSTPDSGESLTPALISKYIVIKADDVCPQLVSQITQACHGKDINQVNALLSRASAEGCLVPLSAYQGCSTSQPLGGLIWVVWHACDAAGGWWCKLNLEQMPELELKIRQQKQKMTVFGTYKTMAEAVKTTCTKINMSDIWWAGQLASCKELSHVGGGVFCINEFTKMTSNGKFMCRY